MSDSHHSPTGRCHCSHRASTTSASPCPTSTRRSPSTRPPSACACVHEETNEEQGVREAMLGVGRLRLVHPAAGPAATGLDDREVPRPHRPGHAAAGLPGRRHRGGRRLLRARRAAAVRRPPRGHGGLPDQLRATPRTPAACSSSWSQPRPPDGRPTSAATLAPRRRWGTSGVRFGHGPRDPNQEASHEAESSTRSSPATRPPRSSPPSPCPSRYRAVTVHKDEVDMFEGLPTRDKDPRKSLHVEEVPMPELGPGRGARRGDGQRDQLQHRVDLDLRAGVDLRLPRALRPHLAARQAARPALPRGRLRPRPASCCGPAPASTRGSPATRSSRTACRSSWRPRRPQRHDARPRAADLGLRDQLRRPGRARAGQGQPADAQARPPDLGGGRQPRAWSTPPPTASWSPATAPA